MNSALAVIEEALRSPETQVRKNSLSALAVLGTPAALKSLVNIAVNDNELAAREKATEEILALKDDAANLAVQYLVEALRDNKTRQAAYCILGRLRNRGISVPKKTIPLLGRLGLVVGLSRYLVPRPDFTFRIRALKPAMIAGALGMILLVGLQYMTDTFDSYNLFRLGIVMLILCFFVPVIVSQRTSGLGVQLYILPALLKELFFAVVLGAVAGLAVGLILLFIGLFEFRDVAFFKFAGKISLTAGVIRLGSLAGVGFFPSSLRTRSLQLCTGVAFGIIYITAVPLLLGGVDNSYAQLSWMLLLPMTFALASSFERIDADHPAKRPPMGRFGGIAALTLIAVTVLAFSMALPRPYADSSIPPIGTDDVIVASGGLELDKDFLASPGRFSKKILASYPQTLVAQMATSYPAQCDAMLRNQAGEPSYYILPFSRRLDPGSYTLDLYCFWQSSSPASALPVLISRFEGRLHISRENVESARPRLSISLRPLPQPQLR